MDAIEILKEHKDEVKDKFHVKSIGMSLACRSDVDLGRCVVAKELKDCKEKEVDTNLHTFIIKKVAGKYRIVFYGSS